MSFEDDIMDAAYKSLEGTEKFCDTSRKFSELFSSGSHSQRFTPHQRLYRKSIIADCLLFEAILVFIRQSLTSYVKGGYLIRKAWKMYEKIYKETEQLCSQPSPISQPGVTSPTDKHVGSSLYDDKNTLPVTEEGVEMVGEEEEEGESEEILENVAALGNALAMQLGFGVGVGGDLGQGGGENVVQNGSKCSSSSSLSHSPNAIQPSSTGTEGSQYIYVHTSIKHKYVVTVHSMYTCIYMLYVCHSQALLTSKIWENSLQNASYDSLSLILKVKRFLSYHIHV